MNSLAHLNKYLLKYRWRLLLGMFFIIVSNVFAIYPAHIIRDAFDYVAELVSSSEQKEATSISMALLKFGGLVLLFAILKGIFLFFTRQTLIIMSRLIEYDLKNEVYAHYQNLDTAFYRRNNTGDIMNRISEDVSRVRMYLGPAIMYTINLAVLFVLVVATMLSVNIELTLYCLLPLPILSITIYYVSNLINKKSELVQRQQSRLSTFVQEAFSGIRVLKAYTRENFSENQFNIESQAYKQVSLKLVKINALFHPVMILLIGLSTIFTIYVGGKLSIDGVVSTGNIAEFVIYVNMLTWPVAALGWVTSLVQRAAASQKRINEFLQVVPQINNRVGVSQQIKGGLKFNNVTFIYPDSGIKALNNVSFELKPGESLAIIGKTGSGKSTIANLICRLYDPTEGDIEIDGKPIVKHDLNTLRNNIGYVPQDVFLFSETISENIAFGVKNGADNQKVKWAAQLAAIRNDVEQFPQKFETLVGERGITLSGGQKQRVSIARAIIKEPQFLIFDDCLSAVDTQTEEQILAGIGEVLKGKTAVIIAHRVSTVKNADRIIVLNNGSIVEQGNHAELINKMGEYQKLYQKQLIEETHTI